MADSKISSMIGVAALLFLLVVFGCAGRAPEPPLTNSALGGVPLWLPAVRNNTNADLRLPGANPLRSLGEMAGKISPDYRETVMNLLRDALRREAEQRKLKVRYPEEFDARLTVLPLAPDAAARIARQSQLEGALLLGEIRRWESEASGLLRLWIEFQLVRIADGTIMWERRVQRVVPAGRSGNPAEVHRDAVKEVVKELF